MIVAQIETIHPEETMFYDSGDEVYPSVIPIFWHTKAMFEILCSS